MRRLEILLVGFVPKSEFYKIVHIGGGLYQCSGCGGSFKHGLSLIGRMGGYLGIK
jgi:hypothetical protein